MVSKKDDGRLEELKLLNDKKLKKLAEEGDYEACMIIASRILYSNVVSFQSDYEFAGFCFLKVVDMEPKVGVHVRPRSENFLNAACCFQKAGDSKKAASLYHKAGLEGDLRGFFRAGVIAEREGNQRKSQALYRAGLLAGHIPSEGRYIRVKYLSSKKRVFRYFLGKVFSLRYKLRFALVYIKNRSDPQILT